MTPLEILILSVIVAVSIVVCVAVNRINREDNTYYGRMCAGCPPRIDEKTEDSSEDAEGTAADSTDTQ